MGPLYYLFGSPGSPACATVARLDGTVTPRGQHCLLAGPESSARALRSDLPPGVSPSDGEQSAAIPHRGAVDSRLGTANQQNQHFAIALDQQLLSVPSIDFKTYPDGVTGGFTRHSAQELATILRTGPLPVNLIPLGS